VPTDEQIAALAAALTALRSRWRRAAIEGAVAPWSRR
jgi:hypothetical protein